MRNLVNRMVALFVVATITSTAALATTSKREVTFSEPVTVNGVLVKEGTYQVRFDDETNQLTIVKGTKVIARAQAQLKKADGTRHTSYVTRSDTNDSTKPPELLTISLKGGSEASIVSSGD
jgi:hypothetical protein